MTPAQIKWLLIACWLLAVVLLVLIPFVPWWRHHRSERRDNVRALKSLVKTRRDSGHDWYDPKEFRR